jgi:catechol 2,3-dioxygenase-like lactoylglutathione lyase family enzyme
MDLNHLHLHVRDVARSRRFYETYFGFREKARHGEILFLTNDQAFDLALAPAANVEPFPPWFHFGFRLPSSEAVRALHRQMTSEGVPAPRPLVDDPDLVSFRCTDPDGYAVEVYWE